MLCHYNEINIFKESYMQQKFGILILLLILVFTFVPAQDLYDINNITTVELTFSASNWDYLLDQLYAAGDEERLMATAIINGIQFDSVGVRYKGNSSYNSQNAKNPLNIKLDYMIDDQEYDNYGTLKLSNVYKDPSFVREVISYEIARNYMPASLSNYAKVTINGTYKGLYTSTQDVDKFFAQSHYGSKTNAFFKGELTNDNPNSTSAVWSFNGILSSAYTSYFELESDEGWNELINFLDVFNNDADNMEEVLNVDRHLWMLAFDNLMVNLDAPINFAHNYYLYQDNAGRFNPILWDMNENFGVFSRLLTGSELSISGMQQMNPYLNASSSYYPIIKQVISNDRYKKIYVAHMKTIIKDYFTDGEFRARALELQDFIDTEVLNDPNKFYTYNNFISNVDASVSTSTGGRPGPSSSIVGLTQLMDARVTYLNSHSDFTPIAPTISNVGNFPSEITIGDNVTFTCDISSGDTVKFCYRYSVNDAFTKVDMHDDGTHGDASADDGVYGVTIAANSSYLEYYIYSENDHAASFLPEGAEYDVYKMNITGKLVLNEFMADNETSVMDKSGDYDDWIELYNITDNDIDLSGYYLSDKADELELWAFPDTTIPAKSYLIVWADKDEYAGELHANFKLSASGEAIYLCDASAEVIDEIVFGSQAPDISQGRYENGVGDWVFMSPSFSAGNIYDQSAVDEDILMPSEFKLNPNYPNPFNPVTTLDFTLAESGEVSLKIYNASGRLVDSILDHRYCASGRHSYQWNALHLASGAYIAVLHSGIQRSTQKMILLK